MERTAFPLLRTQHHILREITQADSLFWLRNFSDAETVELTAYPAPANESASRSEIIEFCTEPFVRGEGIRWGIAESESGPLLGTVGYHGWAKADRRARVGYDLLPEHRGRGVMTEALRIVLTHGFESMNLNRVEAHVDPRNAKSINLLSRSGFSLEGTLREHTFFGDSFRSESVYSLLRREWERGRSRSP